MAIHSKWSSGCLVFYDGSTSILTIKNSSSGIVFHQAVTSSGGMTGDVTGDLAGNITYPDPATVAATGNITLTSTSNRIQFIKVSTGATGGVILILPATAAGNTGIEFKVFNNTTGGDYPVTAKLAVATGATVATLQQQEGASLVSDGTNWAGLVGSNT